MASYINSEILLSFVFVGERVSEPTLQKNETALTGVDLFIPDAEGEPVTVSIPCDKNYDRWRSYSYPLSVEGGTVDLLRISIGEVHSLVIRGNFLEFCSNSSLRVQDPSGNYQPETRARQYTSIFPLDLPAIFDPEQRYRLVIRGTPFKFTAKVEKERVNSGSSRSAEVAKAVVKATRLLTPLADLVRDYALPLCSLPSHGLRQVGLDKDLGEVGPTHWQVLPGKMTYWGMGGAGYRTLEFGPSATVQGLTFPNVEVVWCAALVAPGTFVCLTTPENWDGHNPAIDVSEYHVLTGQAPVSRPSNVRGVKRPAFFGGFEVDNSFIGGVEPHTGEVMFLNSGGCVFFKNESGCYEEQLFIARDLDVSPHALYLATAGGTTHIVALYVAPRDPTYNIYVTTKAKDAVIRREEVRSKKVASAFSYPYLFTSSKQECLRWDIRTMECTVIFSGLEGYEVSALTVFDAYLAIGLCQHQDRLNEIHFYDIAYDTWVGRGHFFQNMNPISILDFSEGALFAYRDNFGREGTAFRYLFEPVSVKK